MDAAVGAALKQLRTSRGVSMAALGRHLGLSYQQIQKYERGDNRMVASVLFRIADFFGVDVGDLFAPANAFRKRAISGGLTVLTVPGDPMQRHAPEQELVRAVSNYAKIPDERARGDINRLMERLAGAPCSRCGPKGGERYFWEAP